MMEHRDQQILELFARRIREQVPSANIWAFGSRARGSADPESDFDLCVLVPHENREIRESIHRIAWEIGFESGVVLTPIVLTRNEFEDGPMSASTLVANIRRDGIAA